MAPCSAHFPPEPQQPLLVTASPSQQTPLRRRFSILGRAVTRQTRGAAGSTGCSEAARHLPTVGEAGQRLLPAACSSRSGSRRMGPNWGGSSRELQPPCPSLALWPLLSSSSQGPAGSEESTRPHLREAAALQSHESSWSIRSESVLVTR